MTVSPRICAPDSSLCTSRFETGQDCLTVSHPLTGHKEGPRTDCHSRDTAGRRMRPPLDVHAEFAHSPPAVDDPGLDPHGLEE